MVQRTKLVRFPMESSPSMTNNPPKQRMLRIKKLVKVVITKRRIPQQMCFFLPTSNTFFSNEEQLLLQTDQLAKDRTTLMLLNTSVAREVANARLFEYSFCNFLIILKRKSNPKEMIGVRTIMNSVNFQLMTHKKSKLPRNCKKFLTIIDKLSEQTEQTVAISLPNLDKSSPVLVLSQYETSFSMILSKSSCLIDICIFSPSILKVNPLMAEKMAMKIVSTTN